jgi:hypothetical protein
MFVTYQKIRGAHERMPLFESDDLVSMDRLRGALVLNGML